MNEEKLRDSVVKAAIYWRNYFETRALEYIPPGPEHDLAKAIDTFRRLGKRRKP